MRSCPQKAGFAPLRGGVIFLPQKDRFCRGPPKLATFLDFNESLWKSHSNFLFKHIWQAGLPSWLGGKPGLWMESLRFPPCRVTKLRKVERVCCNSVRVRLSIWTQQKEIHTFWDNGSVPLPLKFLFKIFPFKIMVIPESPQRFFWYPQIEMISNKRVQVFIRGGCCEI